MKQLIPPPVSRRQFVKGSAAAATIRASSLATTRLPPAATRSRSHSSAAVDEARACLRCAGEPYAQQHPAHRDGGCVCRADRAHHQDLQNQFHEKVDVPPSRRFVGLDAFEKAIAAGPDIVLLCTPPGFRPAQFAAAVKAGKHAFLEKPVAVDAPGYRTVKSANAEAKQKGLYVAVGHNMRHTRGYIEGVRQIHDGLIGDLTLHAGLLQYPGNLEPPAAAGHDRDAISGEQLVPLCLAERRPHSRTARPRHRRLQLDWGTPVQATGIGGRQVRAERGIGEIFDHHCVQYTYPDGSYSFSECRQQPGCWSKVGYDAHGTKGSVSFGGRAVVIQLKGAEPKRLEPGRDGHQTEWDDLLAAVVATRPYNELEWAADSTLTAILGRMATYSGKLVTWDEAVKSDLTYAPTASPGTPPHAPRQARTASIRVRCRASRRRLRRPQWGTR